MRTKAGYSELDVRDVTVKAGETTILKNVRAHANSGELLAILGPTGSGKSTLLNVISGRLKVDSGTITLSGKPFTKRLRRRLAFVQQQDVFFSQLTLWETLYFTAQLRLPDTMLEKEKRDKIDEIVEALDMKKCLNTVIGDIFTRGLSGGEKKRASIACELLTDPDILVMDEPTSGLDSSTALTMMQQMKVYANTYNKTIITSIHQPSSQIFYMFNTMLLLINGQEAYYGPVKNALNFFENLGFVCENHFNPADFILQMAKADPDAINRILSASSTQRSLSESQSDAIDELGNTTAPVKPATNGEAKAHIRQNDHDVTISLLPDTDDTKDMSSIRWETSWLTQYKMLSWRSFKQAKGTLLEGYAIIQTIILSVFVGILFWQIDVNASNVRDIQGMIFFVVSYWTFTPAFEAIVTYPAEKGVIAKERAAGSYRLSAYFLCKVSADLPLNFILPTFMYTVLFTMSGIGGIEQFVATFPVILMQIILSQMFGFALGVGYNGELKPAFTTFASYALCAMMSGGFFTQKIPSWLAWTKYGSFFMYPFGTMSHVIFRQFPPLQCSEELVSLFPQCKAIGGVENNVTVFIQPADILENAGITLPIVYYIFPVVIFILILQIVGYLFLRYRRPQIL